MSLSFSVNVRLFLAGFFFFFCLYFLCFSVRYLLSLTKTSVLKRCSVLLVVVVVVVCVRACVCACVCVSVCDGILVLSYCDEYVCSNSIFSLRQ